MPFRFLLPIILATALLSGALISKTQVTSATAADPELTIATNYFEIVVPQGRMIIRLYDETPGHRDNFRKLAADGFFDGTTFHRVIDGFMIQGGDPNSKDDDPHNDGHGGPGYTIPAEIVDGLFHKRGAVAAARTGDAGNPERRSSGSQFYIVHGTTYDDKTLDLIEQQTRMALRGSDFRFGENARKVYRTVGGTPNLDGQYTVFGEVVEGLEILDEVAATPTARGMGRRTSPQLVDRPLDEVAMTVRPILDYEPSADDDLGRN